MKQIITMASAAALLLAACTAGRKQQEVTLMTLDPGHFHAALVQKSQYANVTPDVYVYAPAGNDVQEYLKKIDGYNTRAENPTSWNEIVYTGNDFFEKMIAEKKGNVMVTSGNNRKKTDYILQTLEAGINVLADKPMAINSDAFKKLEQCFQTANDKRVLLYDIMTERFEISTILQKELSQMPDIYGEQELGTPDHPGISIESVHYFYKNVSGNALIRPAWFYDVNQQGECIVDVMVHLVDLVQWECFPEQAIDYAHDIRITSARHWVTPVDKAQFKLSTGLDGYPDFLQSSIQNDTLQIYANGEINYQLKGLNAKVVALWEYESPDGGDTHYSTMRGTKSNIVIKQGAEQGYRPELYIEPVGEIADIEKSFAALAAKYPGIALEQTATGWHVSIPDSYRVGHEAHFGQVTQNFLHYLANGDMPAWEVPNMLAKYYTTTEAWRLAQENTK